MLMLTTSAALFSQEDCDLFNIQELSAAYLNFSVDTVILQFDGSYEIQLSNGTTASITFGCTDSDYLEYNAAANTDDGSCATLVVEGCTDPAYTEYNAAANTDDGSCATLVVEGCTDPAYTEYNAAANTDDGSCSTAVVEGCTDTAYLEYNAAANTDDGSCITPVVEGCTDPADVNYDAAANTDDGSCASACTDVRDERSYLRRGGDRRPMLVCGEPSDDGVRQRRRDSCGLDRVASGTSRQPEPPPSMARAAVIVQLQS